MPKYARCVRCGNRKPNDCFAKCDECATTYINYRVNKFWEYMKNKEKKK